jgi:hypothetical protein
MNWLKVKLSTATKMSTANTTDAQNAQWMSIDINGTPGASCEPATPANAAKRLMAKSVLMAMIECDLDNCIYVIL